MVFVGYKWTFNKPMEHYMVRSSLPQNQHFQLDYHDDQKERVLFRFGFPKIEIMTHEH